MTNLIPFLLGVGYNIAQAKYDSLRIKSNLRIYHGINALSYSIVLFIFYCLFPDFGWSQVLSLLVARIPVFNCALNYYRGLPLNYTSSKTTSVIDRLTYKIVQFMGFYTYNFVLLVVSFILLFY